MSRRSSRAPSRTSRPSGATRRGPDAGSPCPCGLPAAYGDCCGRFHDGRQTAATAEQLMRSRYSAYAVGDTACLLRTWDPRTRPERLDLGGGTRWTGLEVTAVSDGSAFHSEGMVAFRARYRERGAEHVMEERSRFVRHGGAWVYLDALP